MTHKPNKNYDQVFALVLDKDTSQTHCVWAFRRLGSWSLGGIYPCFNYAFFAEKGPGNAGFSENKCIWNTEVFIYLINLSIGLILFVGTNLPGILAGEMGPDLDWLLPTGEPTGEGDGPPGMPERCGEAWGENGDCAGLLCSPWLLVEPDALTAELRVASVPVGKSSMDPDKSWRKRKKELK